jgi:Cof subfamily protein (haloacid dehalogenase superfamily)
MNPRAYITDLDGTLLKPDQTLTAYTIEVLTKALKQDVKISFATARGYISAKQAVSSIPWKYPMILYNGALLYDGVKRRVLDGFWLDYRISNEIIKIGKRYGLTPFYFSLDARDSECVLHERLERAGDAAFYRNRVNDPRFRQIAKLVCPPEHRTLSVIYIGLKDELEPILTDVNEQLDAQVHVHMMKDYYIEDHYFLEFSHPQANKREGLQLWAGHMGVNTRDITVFGDHINDLGLFEAGGYRIAVQNAQESIKQLADEIIGSNGEDGVAAYLDDQLCL